ncbi:synaptotagmin-17 isoform X5 [Oryctolagus cuniculus]|uniref:synaptotagmin-17 isoform X5 n=1 Tax=Oryctolagus cuniculus TaxID=9986 RepID=UPI00387A5EEB
MLKFPIYSVLVNREAISSPDNSNTLLASQLPSQDGQLEPLNEGFLSRISDLLLCRWTCRHCCEKCCVSSCCQSSEDEVEILGPFPAQTPPWLMASRSSDKDGDSVHTASDVPLTPRTNSPDGRRSSSDTSKSTYSLTRRISSLESRRPSSPLIDIKPIEFGVLSAKKEPIQPSVLRRTYAPDDYFRKFEPRLYSLDSSSDDVDSLTDEEILSKYQLGMLHFSTQYDLLHNHLTVRVIEARDLPPPISHDGSRQDMAHSNPYVKICLLPDQKNSKQTGVKRKTQKPVFEERYTFDIPFLEAQRRTLLLTVVDFDKFSRHCVIGKVSVPLCEVDLVKGGHWWKALIPSSQVYPMHSCHEDCVFCSPSGRMLKSECSQKSVAIPLALVSVSHHVVQSQLAHWRDMFDLGPKEENVFRQERYLHTGRLDINVSENSCKPSLAVCK